MLRIEQIALIESLCRDGNVVVRQEGSHTGGDRCACRPRSVGNSFQDRSDEFLVRRLLGFSLFDEIEEWRFVVRHPVCLAADAHARSNFDFLSLSKTRNCSCCQPDQ
jgi:hypothetical protein